MAHPRRRPVAAYPLAAARGSNGRISLELDLGAPGGPAVLVMSAEAPGAATARRIAEAHRAIHAAASPYAACHVAPVHAVREEPGAVEVTFQAEGHVTLARIFEHLTATGARASYPASYALADALLTTLGRAHAATPPCFAGELAWDRVVVSTAGDVWFFAFGLDAVVGGAAGPGHVVPLERIAGATPSAAADIYAAFAFFQTMLRFTVLPPALAQALGVVPAEPIAPDLVGDIAAFASAVLSAVATNRPQSVAVLLERFHALHAAAGIACDHAGIAAFLGAQAREIVTLEGEGVLIARGDVQSLVLPDGRSIDLRRRKALRLICARLLRDHREGSAASVDELRAAGWPGETMSVESGRRRAYVAVDTLRRLGLGSFIEVTDGGYRLRPGVIVRHDESPW